MLFAEAEKQAQVAKIVWEQKVMEKESEKRIAEIEGIFIRFCLELLKFKVFLSEGMIYQIQFSETVLDSVFKILMDLEISSKSCIQHRDRFRFEV